MSRSVQRPLVAALDLGTSFSGYAFISTWNPEDVRMNKMLGRESYRTATCILTERGDQGKYVEFGKNAQDLYSRSLSPGQIHCYDLYENFKMVLYNQKKLSIHQKISSLTGTKRQLLDIFVMLFKALINNMLSLLKTKESLDVDQITWVITVPAIWSDAAKQFMEEATLRAGIPRSNTLFISEPEAASLHCMGLGINNFHRATDLYFSKFKINLEGHQYMLIDAGGGTVDVAVHKIIDKNKVKEVYKSTGGPWGGTAVDERFLHLLETILGKEFIEQFKKENPVNWQDFMLTFERQKKAAQPNSKINLSIPVQMERSFRKLGFGELDEKIANMSAETQVTETNGYLVIGCDAATKLFEPVNEEIKSHVTNLLADITGDLDYIILVGGFADSPYLKEAIQGHFSEHIVLIPDDPELAVIKGAVKYGLDPQIITSRKAKKTYGVSTMVPYADKKHKSSKKVDTDTQAWCKDVFVPLIHEDDDVFINTVGKTSVSPISKDVRSVLVSFCSTSRNLKRKSNEVLYTDSVDVTSLGEIQVDIPSNSEEAEVEVSFGDTIIRATAKTRQPGERRELNVKFLTK